MWLNNDEMKSRLVLLFYFSGFVAFSQCPSVNLAWPASACLNSNFQPVYTPTGNEDFYFWDFCDGSLLNTPQIISSGVPSGVNSPYDIKTVQEGVNYLSFIVNSADNKIIKLDFGSSLSNSPSTTDLGDFGTLSSPHGICLWQEGAQKYALVTTGTGLVYLLNFGTSFTNTPTISSLGSTGVSDLRHVKIVKENMGNF